MNRIAVFIVVAFLGFSLLASGQTQIIATVAGIGTTGSSGDGGPATAAQLFQPGGVALDAAGDIFIADTNNNRIQEVAAGSGIVTTVVGNGGLLVSPLLSQPGGVFVDAAGDLFIADTGNNTIRELVAGSNTLTTVAGGGSQGFYGDTGQAIAAALWSPQGVAVDAAGDIFIADTQNNRIRKVAVGGIITTVAGNGVAGFAGDGGAATSAELYDPTGIFVDPAGNLYIADRGNSRIRKVSPSGTISTIVGNGIASYSGDNGPAISAALYNPSGVFVDALGNVFIAATFNNRIREVATSGVITTVAGDGALGFYGDGGAATAALLNHPGSIAVDGSGDIFIADTGNNRIREVSASTVPPPTINPGGVVPVFSTMTTIEPGEWVSIYGTNLASATANWTGNFPTSLGGTSVTIDGVAAYLSYVSAGQIDLQAPDDSTIGPVTVVVSTAVGQTSSTVNLGQFAPSFSLLDSKHVAGIILRSNGLGAYGGGAYDIIGPTGNSLGYATVAAKAGDTIELYAVGFGPTSPAVLAGQAFSGQAPTTNTVNLLINNKSVIPTFAGLSSGGLDQINLTIPSGLGTGDVPLAATVGGAQTQTGVVISLQ